MAPEQIRAEPVSPATDIYSLGLVLFEMLAGRPAIGSKVPADVFLAQIATPPPALPPQIDSKLVAIVNRCIDKNPVRRPRDGATLVAELEEWLEYQRVERAFARADTRPPRPELAPDALSEALVRAVAPPTPIESNGRTWWMAACWTLLGISAVLIWLLLKVPPRPLRVYGEPVPSEPVPQAIPRIDTATSPQLPKGHNATISEARVWQDLSIEGGPQSPEFWQPRWTRVRPVVAECRGRLTEPTRVRWLTVTDALTVVLRPIPTDPAATACFQRAAQLAQIPAGSVVSFEVRP